MKYSTQLVDISMVTRGQNPRIETNYSLASLCDNIAGVGLQEPITVWERVKGQFEVIKGHRRTMAIELLKQRDPKRFNELFAKGIMAHKVSDITPEEVVLMKLDHSEQRGLSDPHELLRSAQMLFNIGKTEADVANQLAGLIDKINPMKQKARVELEAIQAKLLAAKASKNEAGITVAERDIRDFISNYRRGFVQGLHNTCRCPDKVMDALYKKATGKNPEGNAEYLPDVGSVEVTALWKAHQEDLKILEGGVPKYNKVRVGPNFTEKWNKLIEKSQAEEVEGKAKDAKPKAMSAKDMQQEIKDGKFRSELACKLTAHHSGDKAIDDLTVLDTASYQADLVRRHDANLWATIQKASKEIETRLIEADKKAEVKA